MGVTIVGVSNTVEVTTTSHALVTTGISGLAAGDLLIACIASRIASTTAVTLPAGGEFSLVNQINVNNTATNSTAASSLTVAYCVRGGSDPDMTFTHPTAPSVAIGKIIAYRGTATTANVLGGTTFAGQTISTISPNWNVSITNAGGITPIFPRPLCIMVISGGQESTWSAVQGASGGSFNPGTSGATDTTTAPVDLTITERLDVNTNTGADVSLAVFDGGATSIVNLLATPTIQAVQSLVVGFFRPAIIPDLTMPPMVAAAGSRR